MPQKPTEQHELVHRLNKLQISEDTHSKNIRQPTTNYNVNPQYFRQWQPQRFQAEYNPNPRLQIYEVPNNNSPNPFDPPNGRFIQRGARLSGKY